MSLRHSALRKNMWSIIVTAFLLAVLILWAGFSDISQTARAQGQIIAVARTQIIQAAIDGVIEKIDVDEGQLVKKGQLLVQLDDKQVAAGLEESQSKTAALKAALVRLRAEVLDTPLTFPEDIKMYPQFIQSQKALFKRRQAAIKGDVDALRLSLSLVNKELALNQPLLATGDVGQADIIRLERQAADIQGQIAGRRSKYFQDSQAEMTKVEEDLSTQESIRQDRMATYQRAQINAPADGLVKSIAISTPGARVRPGDVILELVPTSGEFVMESKLKPADIASIRKGLPAKIQLDAYDYSIYGMLNGQVVYVSPDALTERTAQGETVYYRVHVMIDKKHLMEHNTKFPNLKIEIQPGMTGTTDIETGQHSVLSYLTKPITKTMNESMNER